MFKKAIFKWFNSLYKYNFKLYYVFYYIYKYVSDYSKIKFLKSIIKNGNVVYDIGSNVGFYTKLLSDLVSSTGQVHAFEPDRLNFSILEKRFGSYQNIFLYNMAVGEYEGKIKLYESEDMNVDHQTFDSGEGRVFTEVDVVSIDTFMSESTEVDFIKIDIQGYDYYAIKGMQKTISRSRSISIFGEFWPYALDKAGVSPHKYLELLSELQFEVEILGMKPLDDIKLLVKRKEYYTDYIAKRKVEI